MTQLDREKIELRLAHHGRSYQIARDRVEELRTEVIDPLIEQALLAGFTSGEIERLSGVSVETVRKIMKKAGLPAKRGRPAKRS